MGTTAKALHYGTVPCSIRPRYAKIWLQLGKNWVSFFSIKGNAPNVLDVHLHELSCSLQHLPSPTRSILTIFTSVLLAAIFVWWSAGQQSPTLGRNVTFVTRRGFPARKKMASSRLLWTAATRHALRPQLYLVSISRVEYLDKSWKVVSLCKLWLCFCI